MSGDRAEAGDARLDERAGSVRRRRRDAPAEAGTTVAGYRLVRLVGTGGGCQVFLARPAHRGAVPEARAESVAVKIVPPTERSRGEAEILALQSVESDHVVGLVDVATLADGGVCLVQTLAARGTAASLVARRGGITPGETVTLVASVLRGLGDLHDAGLAHGALDLGHVLIDASGRPLLCGLGSSRPSTGRDEADGQDRDPVGQDLVRVARIAEALRDPAIGRPRVSDQRWDAWEELLDAVIHGESDLSAHELADRLLEVADAAPLAEASTHGGDGLAGYAVRLPDVARLGPGGTQPRADDDFRDARAPRRRGATPTASVRRHRATPDRAAVRAAGCLGALRHGVRRGLAEVRPRVWVLGGAALLLVALVASALPTMASSARGGSADPADARVDGASEDVPSDTAPSAAATTPPVTDGDIAAVAGDDPALAASALLRIRATCVHDRDVSCLAGADQRGSAAEDADQALIAGGASPGAASSHEDDRVGGTQRMGDTVLVQLLPETGSAEPQEAGPPEPERRPASLLIVRGEAGWRIRDLMDDR
ncbi:serine/threonine protein kinase [Clavibacter michiganensis]|nr:serine/threonine protein kinase [Clavibacter michiganensis]